MAIPAISIPSRIEWGSDSRRFLSMKAPGSPSSPLQTTYFTPDPDTAFLQSSHFLPVGKPAPPLPLKPDSETMFIIFSVSGILRALDRA